MALIEIDEVSKTYDGGKEVLSNVSLDIESGEFVTILGPSGCGKTTLLKMVNKLIPFDQGVIRVNGKSLADWDSIELRRSIGYVIQQIGLLPHLTIEQNISYVLSLESVGKLIKKARAKELIDLVGLSQEHLSRYPRQLSGGQKQRVGVARALAADPDIILMDEPFGAVDEIARTSLQDEFKLLHKKLGKTIVFVTHDIGEALKLGTKIVLMNNGCIEQMGNVNELIFKPQSDFVKDFFGIKGFQATLNEDVMQGIYDKLLSKEMTLDELHERLTVRCF